MARKGETLLQEKVQAELKKLGCKKVWKNHGSAYSENGISDVMGVYRGVLVAVECKEPGKEPTKLQEKFMREIRESGGCAFPAWSAGDVQAGFNKFFAGP